MLGKFSFAAVAIPMLAFCGSVYDYSPKSIDGAETPLSAYKGKVLLIVNVASKCGFTPQYKSLEALYEKYKDQGFLVLGFPANNFMQQEPGTDDEIKQFCTRKYSVSFPMFSKISVKGDDKYALYTYLTSSAENPKTGGEIKWNFTKFLVDRNGTVIARFEPNVDPLTPDVTQAVEGALKQ